jgi:hypothetical protein
MLNELHAKVGRLRSEAETMSFVDLSRFLDEQLQNPIVLLRRAISSQADLHFTNPYVRAMSCLRNF